MTAARNPESTGPSATAPESRRQWVSNAIDGECPAGDADALCRQWRSDESLRADWHAYHLIGDVLRSDELSAAPARDEAFLRKLRSRLADEPVPLAPSPLIMPAARADSALGVRPRRWLASAAVAAGFVAVGVAFVALRPESGSSPTGWGGAQMAATPPAEGLVRQVGSAAAPASGQALRLDGQIIRDARLDAYFEAHRGAGGVRPTAVPGGALRNVDVSVARP